MALDHFSLGASVSQRRTCGINTAGVQFENLTGAILRRDHLLHIETATRDKALVAHQFRGIRGRDLVTSCRRLLEQLASRRSALAAQR